MVEACVWWWVRARADADRERPACDQESIDGDYPHAAVATPDPIWPGMRGSSLAIGWANIPPARRRFTPSETARSFAWSAAVLSPVGEGG
jgi:hypothetical protein